MPFFIHYLGNQLSATYNSHSEWEISPSRLIVKLKLVRYDWNGNIGFVSFELDLAARRRLIVTLGLVLSALSWNCSSYRAAQVAWL